jgi:hypothetical protein
MMRSLWFALLAVAGVALIAWVMRRMAAGGDDQIRMPSPEAEGEGGPSRAWVEEEEEGGGSELLAVTSDGRVFVPDGAAVRLIPIGDPARSEEIREDIEAGMMAAGSAERAQLQQMRSATAGKPGWALDAGDFTAARIRRGAAGVVPWRLETLGRDGDYGFFPFEAEDGARAAIDLLEHRGIVQRPLDDDGRPIPASPEDFEEARRRYDETERALALEQDPDEPAPDAGWSNRR